MFICFCRVPVCTNCMLCIEQSPSLLPSITIVISIHTKLHARSLSESQLLLATFCWYMEHLNCKQYMDGWMFTVLNTILWSTSRRKMKMDVSKMYSPDYTATTGPHIRIFQVLMPNLFSCQFVFSGDCFTLTHLFTLPWIFFSWLSSPCHIKWNNKHNLI